MATKTLGTAATTTLHAVSWSPDANLLLPADMATINALVKNDQTSQLVVQPSFGYNGLLYVPNRGVLQILPGDWIGVDTATGFVVLVSKAAAAGAGWVHS